MYTYFENDILTVLFAFGGAYLCLRCFLLTLALELCSKWGVGLIFLSSGNNNRLKVEFESLKRLIN